MAAPTTGTTTPTIPDPLAGQQLSTESSLSNWAGPYVTNMLGKGQALSETPYQAYMGPLTAGASSLQNQAFQGVAGLTLPQNMGAFNPQSFTSSYAPPAPTNDLGIGSFMQDQFNPNAASGNAPPGAGYAPNNQNSVAQRYMNPYLMASLNPQLDEARRQAQITRMGDAARLTKAGAYGGSRQAIMESELNRNLMGKQAEITGQGYKTAYDVGQQQFNTEQQRQMEAQNQANQYGLTALGRQAELGGVQRGIEGEGIAADYGQFKEERDYPFKQVQYQQSLLQGMPLATQSYSYQQPSTVSNIAGTAGGLMAMYESLFGPKKT